MMILNQHNFSVRSIHKEYDSRSASKDVFYSDLRICLVLRGEAVWEIEDRSNCVAEGDVIFLNIGQRRCFTAFGKNGFDLGIFNLSHNSFSELHHFMFFRDRAVQGKNVIRNPSLSSLLREVFDEWKKDFPFRYEFASAKFTEFFIKAERIDNYSFAPVQQSDREFLRLLDEIDRNITSGIRLQAVAKQAGMAESTFSRRFFALTGISYGEYVLEKKMQHALFLLKTTDLNMIDVAFESGFSSVSGFYDAFKKRFGTTPGKLSLFDL